MGAGGALRRWRPFCHVSRHLYSHHLPHLTKRSSEGTMSLAARKSLLFRSFSELPRHRSANADNKAALVSFSTSEQPSQVRFFTVFEQVSEDSWPRLRSHSNPLYRPQGEWSEPSRRRFVIAAPVLANSFVKTVHYQRTRQLNQLERRGML